jgi:tRNA pseudouridine55 synthase
MLPRGGGVILVDKDRGVTSHDAVSAMRRVTGFSAVGHTGTLDPMASGLLLICLGPATKLSPYLSGRDKEYLGTVTFGVITDTLDATGEVLEQRHIEGGLDEERIRAAMASRTGEIEQVPPMTSAVKVDGVKLYKLARKGIEVEREARRVRVDVFELLRCGEDSADFRVVCSSGTYVRCLAAEVGEALGCGGHLSSLRRTRVGSFDVADAITVGEHAAEGAAKVLKERVIPAAKAVGFLPYVVLEEEGMRALRNGAVAPESAIVGSGPGEEGGPGEGDASTVRVLDEEGGLSAIGVMEEGSGGVRPLRVLQSR